MQSTKLLRSTLSLSLFVLAAGMMTAPAHAVVLNNNLRDGLEINLQGAARPTLGASSSKFTYHYGDTAIFDRYDRNGNRISVGTIEDVLAYQDREANDERLRIDGIHGAGIWVGAEQRLTRDITIDGEAGLWAWGGGAVVNQFGLSIRRANLGSLHIKSNSGFPTRNVATSSTYTALDTQGSAVSARYTKIPNFTLGTYYAFPESNDTRVTDSALHGGHGILASYEKSFSPYQSVLGGVAYTHGKRDVHLQSDRSYKEKDAYGVGVRYKYQDFTVGLDASRGEESLNGALVDKIDIDTYGLRLTHATTPRINTTLYYGQRTDKKTASTGNTLSYINLLNNRSGVTESILFDEVRRKQYGVNMDYSLYAGVTLSGSVGKEEITNYLTDGKFSERKNLNYRAGVSFWF